MNWIFQFSITFHIIKLNSYKTWCDVLLYAKNCYIFFLYSFTWFSHLWRRLYYWPSLKPKIVVLYCIWFFFPYTHFLQCKVAENYDLNLKSFCHYQFAHIVLTTGKWGASICYKMEMAIQEWDINNLLSI